jgi:hypothetical protein
LLEGFQLPHREEVSLDTLLGVWQLTGPEYVVELGYLRVTTRIWGDEWL